MTPGIVYSAQVYVPLFPSYKPVLNPYVQSRVGGGFPQRQSSIVKFSRSHHALVASIPLLPAPHPSGQCSLSLLPHLSRGSRHNFSIRRLSWRHSTRGLLCPLFRCIALRCPSMDRCDLRLESGIHQSVSGERRLFRKFRGDDNS